MSHIHKYIYCLVSIFILTYHASVQAIDPASLSIEQLMEKQVTSVTKTEQKFSDTAAAVYVVTQDDIQRSGVTNIPDVLRMVPGIHVARVSADNWAVTARGFNSRFANKLLVLLDGQMIYSPTFAGVRWENLDLVLDDIARIEVIRGPGASVWGQNAVNGVINIITKHSEDTQQGLISVTSGNKEHAIAELRYGDQLNDHIQYRLFGKFFQRDGFIDEFGKNAQDDWNQGKGGFRVDWNSHAGNRLLFKGSGFVSNQHTVFSLPEDTITSPIRKTPRQNSGANFLVRWEHDLSIAAKFHTQLYYEYFDEGYTGFASENTHTFGVDFQNDIALWKGNNFNWGLSYRLVADSQSGTNLARLNPEKKTLHLASGFIQDSAAFFDDKLLLTLGTKIQYYTLSGWDYQPSARVLWKFHPKHRLWAAFSRSIRSPSRGETALSLQTFQTPNRKFKQIIPITNKNLKQEKVLSYELGYRSWIGNTFSVDLTLFYNDYEDLISVTAGPDFASRSMLVSFTNDTTAKTWGIEAAVDWRPTHFLRLQSSYSFLQFIDRDIFRKPRTDPSHQFSFRGSYDIMPSLTFDLWVRYVNSFTSARSVFYDRRKIKNYVGLDMRIAWQPVDSVELSIVGQNINNNKHIEFMEGFFTFPEQIQRSVHGKIRWNFK